MAWIAIGTLEQIPALGARTVETPKGQVAVFRAADDSVFALLNRCPHKNGPLSEGIVAGHTVACPLHNWVIDLTDGQAKAPDEGCTRNFPVKAQDGQIWLDV